MRPGRKILFLSILIAGIQTGCDSQSLKSPEKIGSRKRNEIRTGAEAQEVIDRLHGLKVATDENLIATYGQDKKDLLYISSYENALSAQEAFGLMTKKISLAKGGPFYHVMPLKNYSDRAFITLGMGATHYIFISGRFLIWFQTYQSFGQVLPEELTVLYPVKTVEPETTGQQGL
jgi:hypothetical protein